ncbi:MAG: hypothetical protein KBC73_23790 [Burkholderiaceae bacterium]|nr:hypothetical protein [Burkholderiaceae bacterium]
MVWLVLGGPAAVVVAGVATAVIAYHGADEVLLAPPAVRERMAEPGADTPAVQARNHAATAAVKP